MSAVTASRAKKDTTQKHYLTIEDKGPFAFVQGDDDEADWDLEMMNEEDDAVVHWVSKHRLFLVIAAL